MSVLQPGRIGTKIFVRTDLMVKFVVFRVMEGAFNVWEVGFVLGIL